MGTSLPRGSLAALGLGLAALIGCSALEGRAKPEPAEQPEPAPPDALSRIRKMLAARQRLIWSSVEDRGFEVRMVWDSDAERWIAIWPVGPWKEERPSGLRFD